MAFQTAIYTESTSYSLMSQKDLDKIIRDYLSGKHSPEGEELFNTWYASHNDATSPLDGMNSTEKEKLRQEIFAKVKATTAARPQKPPTTSITPGRKLYPFWYRIAAVWAGLLLLAVAYYLYVGQQNDFTIVQTAYGEIKTITLPDGSEVMLNANSTLRYATNWKENTDIQQAPRQVWLDGEAFFSVVHTQHDQKFQVLTSNLNVEVLGTEFNVNNRRGDTRVVLQSGKVKLAIDNNDVPSELVMAPGEFVAYSEKDRSITKKMVNPQHYSAWRNQELILDNTSLAEIAWVLEDYYGFEVIIQDDTLKNIKISATATFSLKEKEVILSAISEIDGIEMKQEGNQLIFNNP